MRHERSELAQAIFVSRKVLGMNYTLLKLATI